MIEQVNEAELLALIEGELDPDQAAALRGRLADDPAALDFIDRLSGDRQMLRSIEDPPVPEDFVARLEPIMARPLLVNMSSAAYRRKHTQRNYWLLARYAVAAVVAFGLITGMWTLLSGILKPHETSDSQMAYQDGLSTINTLIVKSPDTAVALETEQTNQLLSAKGSIHHARPLSLPRQPSTGPVTPTATLDRSDDSYQPVMADFTLVIESTDTTTAETVMVTALAGVDQITSQSTSIVRNFTYDEASNLLEAYRLAAGAQSSDSGTPQHVSSVDGVSKPVRRNLNRSRRDDSHIRKIIEQNKARLADKSDNTISKQLHGPKDLAPSYLDQLELSTQGATHTISIPVAVLDEFLSRLNDGDLMQVMLRMRSGSGLDSQDKSAAAKSDHRAWVKDIPAVRQSLQRLLAVDENALIVLPVTIRVKNIK